MGYSLTAISAVYKEEDYSGRVLTISEFLERIKKRPDIFGKESSTLTGKIELVCMVSAVLTGTLLSIYKPESVIHVDSDFLDPNVHGVASATVIPTVIDRPKPIVNKVSKVLANLTALKKSNIGDNKQSGRAHGTPTEKVAKRGIFAMVTQAQISNEDAAFGDIAGKGGFSETIDAVIQGVGGLKHGNSSATGRRGVATIGFGKGYGISGNGDGTGGIDDLIGMYQNSVNLELKKGNKHSISLNIPISSGAMTAGGRSRSSIISVVMQNLAAIRYLYNNRLNQKPGLHGKITVRFAIDEFGSVLHCDIIESTINDNELEQKVVSKIRLWRFDKIDKPGDITEIVYPFVFSAG